MYYSIVSNRMESWDRRESNKYVLFGLCCNNSPRLFVFSLLLFFCLWIFCVLILTFVPLFFFIVWQCFQHSFKCPGHVCFMWWDLCQGCLMWIGWCERAKHVLGKGKEKHLLKRKKINKRVCIFQFVNNPYAWKLKSKSGTCLHHFKFRNIYSLPI